MRTIVLGQRPPELDQVIKRRQTLGQDLYDEMWEGSYVMAPAPNPAHGALQGRLARLLAEPARAAGLVDSGPFNLGTVDDYRVPDWGYHRGGLPTATFVATAALVVEITSPDDETEAKFGFYAAHHVDEVLVADPRQRTLRLWRRQAGGYGEADASAVLAVDAACIAESLDWP
jgi:Uma2 family endonuclease